MDSPGNILFIFPEREEVENENSGPKYIQNGKSKDKVEEMDIENGSEEKAKVDIEKLDDNDNDKLIKEGQSTKIKSKSLDAKVGKKYEEKKVNIFISFYTHIEKVLYNYKDKDYDFYYCKDESENYSEFRVNEIKKIYPVKKIKITTKQYKDIYKINNIIVEEYSALNPKYLSLSYMNYLKHSINIKEKSNFFNLTEERKNFFSFLDEKLKEEDLFLPICGPEGIGKTSSILAYCRIKFEAANYFYYNVRAFYDLMKENKKKEIKKMLIEELSRDMNTNVDLTDSVNKIMKNININCQPMEFLINIINNSINTPKLLIIDQYKTALDENYRYLKELLYNNPSFKIILLSSMNEDDVKGCFEKVMKNEKISLDNFFLDYYYVRELAKVSENDLACLDKKEKEILSSFGNLYSIYYELIEFKKFNYGIFDKKNFVDKISNNIKNNLINYYKTKDETKINNILTEIIDIELENLTKNEFLSIYMNIPFRYLKLSIDNKNIFKISEINNAKHYQFEYIYQYFIFIIIILKGEIYDSIQKNQYLLDNIKLSITPLTFENNGFYCIWGNRSFNGDKINRKIKISSIYDLSEKDCINIKGIKDKLSFGDGIILSQSKPNALFFDTAILVYINQNTWRLYLIQITRKKDAQERFTTTSLDDLFGFIDSILEEKCDIKIEQNYFCYIFDDEKRDEASIRYCNEIKLNYIYFNQKEFELNYENKKLNEYKMKKIIIENKGTNLPFIEELLINKFNPKDENFETTKKFLSQKRKLMNPKELKNHNELQNRIKKRENYYNSIRKYFNKVKNIDYNDKEEEVNNYLADTDFINKDLNGIQVIIPNQDKCLKKLKNEGFTDE